MCSCIVCEMAIENDVITAMRRERVASFSSCISKRNVHVCRQCEQLLLPLLWFLQNYALSTHPSSVRSFNSHRKLYSLLMLIWLEHEFYTLVIHKSNVEYILISAWQTVLCEIYFFIENVWNGKIKRNDNEWELAVAPTVANGYKINLLINK